MIAQDIIDAAIKYEEVYTELERLWDEGEPFDEALRIRQDIEQELLTAVRRLREKSRHMKKKINTTGKQILERWKLIFTVTAGVGAIVFSIIFITWMVKHPPIVPGNKVVTYERIPGCMLSDSVLSFEEVAIIDDKVWVAMPEKLHQHIGFLVKKGKAEWMTRPLLICNGQPTSLWYWREKK